VIDLSNLFNRLFAKPKAFRNNTYGYLTNQIGHIYLGFILTSAYVFLMWKLIGVHPNQNYCVAVVVSTYLIFWEGLYQKWSGWDSIEDTLYVFCGAGSFLFIDYQFVITRVVVWLAVITLFLMVGVVVRTDKRE